ncbi:MAG: peptidyl-prolyl cis-trans isomerase D [Rhodospirillaceae bacterium]|nr:MAG: peptidyl-prolyl cis-trans isomerase D [Rhodospirillaceae bacterium]
MLDVLRRSAASWVVKILFVILIVSFGVWGVADYIGSGPSEGPAITVGRTEISLATVREEFNRDVNRVRPMMGNAFTAEEARRLGFMHQTINRLVAATTLEEAARVYGLVAPDELLIATISRQTEFQDTTGRLDPALFRQTLAAIGQSEEAYFAILRRQLQRLQAGGPVTEGVAVPAALLDRLYHHLYEKRVVEKAVIPFAAMPAPSPPDPIVLAEYHTAHAAIFTAPEYRTLSVLLLTGPAVAAQVSISEETIRQAYDDSLPALRMPEMRTVEQVLLPRRELAETLLERVRAGESFVLAATEAGHTVTPLGRITRDAMEPALAGAIFAAAPEAVTGPVESAFGWHLFRVTAIAPEEVPPLESMRDQIRQELVAEKTGDVVYELSGKVEEILNGGASLEEAAGQVGLTVTTFTSLDRSGAGADGKVLSGLPTMKEFLPTAFALAPGAHSMMTESDDGFFVVRVDQLTPSRLKPVDEVRHTLVEHWTAAQRREASRQQAEALAARLKTGMPVQEATKGFVGTPGVSQPLLRTDTEEHFPPAFLERLFSLAIGETIVGETPDAFIAARLRTILPPAADAAVLAKLKEEVTDQYARDIFAQLTAALGREFGVTISPKVLEAP